MATASRPGLHPSDFELGLLRCSVLIPCPFAHSSLRTPFAPTNPPFAWIFQTAFMPPFFRIYHGRRFLPQKSRNKTAMFPHKGRLKASCFLWLRASLGTARLRHAMNASHGLVARCSNAPETQPLPKETASSSWAALVRAFLPQSNPPLQSVKGVFVKTR